MRNTTDLSDPVELTDDQIDMVAGGQVTQNGNVVAVGVDTLNATVGVLVQALNTGAGTITNPIINT